MLRVLLTIGIGGPIFGALFAWYGFKERAVAKESSPTPETMTLSQLIARGPNGNANVIVTDFVVVPDHAVERGRKGRVSGTWVPIVPKDGNPAAGGSARALKALVYCDGSGGPDGAYQRVSSPQLAGMVINKVKTPSGSVEDHFEGAYPQTDFSTCIYIQEGRTPTSETTAMLMIFGGIAAAVIGLGSLVLALIVWQKNKAAEARSKKDRKKRRPRDDDDRPRKRRSAARDDEDEDRPRRRRAAGDDEDEAPREKRRPADDEDGERPSRRRVARDEDEDDRPRKRRPAADDEDDDRPRRRPRRDD